MVWIVFFIVLIIIVILIVVIIVVCIRIFRKNRTPSSPQQLEQPEEFELMPMVPDNVPSTSINNVPSIGGDIVSRPSEQDSDTDSDFCTTPNELENASFLEILYMIRQYQVNLQSHSEYTLDQSHPGHYYKWFQNTVTRDHFHKSINTLIM